MENKRINKKKILLFAVCFLVLIMSGWMIGAKYASAEDNISLIVKLGDKEVQHFYTDTSSGEKVLCYRDSSGREQRIENRRDLSYSFVRDTGAGFGAKDAYGPAIADILKAAGLSEKQYAGKAMVISGEDGYFALYDADTLLDPARYYYTSVPGSLYNGKTPAKDDMNKPAVPAIVNFSDDDNTVRFGQLSPSEHTSPVSVSWVVGEKGAGIIQICDEESGKWINDAAPRGGTVVTKGEELDFKYSDQTDGEKGIHHNYLFYTLDGSTPNEFSAIYNWDPKNEDEFEGPKAPLESGRFTVKTVMMGLAKKKSDVKSITYTVADEDISDYDSAVRFTAKTAVYDGKKKTPSISIKGLKKGTDYTVSYSDNIKTGTAKVVCTGTENTEAVCYAGSLERKFDILPAKASVKKLAKGNGKFTVTVKNQKASGITGYQIYYKEGKSSKWKKTSLSASKTVKAVGSLKKGKSYAVKVRGYKKTGKKTLYGKFSKTEKVSL